jgi:hypothetical protein
MYTRTTTDLHNPSVREDRKMTKDDFIRNNRGISSQGGCVPSVMSCLASASS